MNEPFDPGATSSRTSNIIVVATDLHALRRAENGFAAAFVDPDALHLIEDVGMDDLAGSAIWLEIGEDKGASLDHWLMAFDAFAAHSVKPVSVAMTADMLDIVAARLDGNFDLLVAPDTMQRAGAIGDLFLRSAFKMGINETRGMDDEKRLRELSDEVARIAETLSRLSVGDGGYQPGPGRSLAPREPHAELPKAQQPVTVDTVRATIRARRLREKFFRADYFADPAWDMLLDLFASEISRHRVPVSSLCIAACVPATTALRWMKSLTDAGVFVRRSDPEDGRRVFVELSGDASLAMRRYFEALEGQFSG